jgi:hypothetical protein
MCRAVNCRKCQKPTWAGCGAHVEQVLGHVPKSARCACREAATTSGPEAARPGLLATLRNAFRK